MLVAWSVGCWALSLGCKAHENRDFLGMEVSPMLPVMSGVE